MRYFIVDDDPAIRFMLGQMIEDADLGEVCGEAEDGSQIDHDFLNWKQVDILLIDLLMPNRDGIETVRQLRRFTGKIVMISQIEAKEMIAEAYATGIEYYVTKPVNRLEVISVLQKVRERILLQQSIEGIQRSLSVLSGSMNVAAALSKEASYPEKGILSSARFLLTELGMISEKGSKDLLDMMEWLYRWEKERDGEVNLPPLRDIFWAIADRKLGKGVTVLIQKETKAAEQRVRRAIYQALTHLASLGLTDYSNPKFESYATTFFDFTEVRKRMLELENQMEMTISSTRINTKKFIFVLYMESKRRIGVFQG
ncbi:response regulator [Brevibacillus brevis]|uniref:response regulator n=1 Tax=Brevibacillus brevis TaxID=1393 RepID=UPI000D1115BB|nr:response regulator [Brevibacillus brevis]PSJ69232.1 transcriptional regulator [Brevibacillus brevis]RED27475.1 two-component system response regulator YcbB [Brevibacillus brevis]GEC90825.1 transcriptional regulator [Brevibacillus brevis]VEF91328.1 Chemotaxis protein CheY [Brevibacillus brevis]